MTATEAAGAIARGVRSVRPEATIVEIPMADGGEGTVDAFVAGGWTRVVRRVHGPLGEPVDAAFAWSASEATAAIEMAAASGLALLAPARYDPVRASTFGTGELLRAALDHGARRIVIALGGSATNDGGAGLLAALGVRFFAADGSELGRAAGEFGSGRGVPGPGGDVTGQGSGLTGLGGGALARLGRIDVSGLDPRLRDVVLDVAADVDAPLLGPAGASAVFGPQKGASAKDVAALDAALARFADVTATTLGIDVRNDAGTGAAGGLGFALRAFTGAVQRPGVAVVADVCGLPAALSGAAWCFTGEGAIDAQTLAGKTVLGVAALATAAGVKTTAFAGRVDGAAARAFAARGIACVAIADETLEAAESMRRAAELLERAAARIARELDR